MTVHPRAAEAAKSLRVKLLGGVVQGESVACRRGHISIKDGALVAWTDVDLVRKALEAFIGGLTESVEGGWALRFGPGRLQDVAAVLLPNQAPEGAS